MDLSAWGLYLLIAGALGAAVVLHYHRREPGGRGRSVLAALRAAALAILVLILFDPVLPRPGGARRGTTVVLLDGSLSMRLPGPGGVTRWESALDAVSAAGPARVLIFGAGEGRPVPDPPREAPRETRSRLAPALRAALEAGAERVVVVTDGGVEDAAEVSALLEEARGRVDVRTVGGDVARNVAVEEIDAPRWLEVGEEAAIRVTVARVGGGAGDSVGVVLRREGREVAREAVAVPPAGAVATATLRFTPDEASNVPVRLEAALDAADSEPDDDRRTAYVRISEQPAGVVLVSFRPDQEPRFLLPVLERALGLPVRGWLALPGDRFIRLGVGAEAGAVDGAAAVRRAVAAADLRVFHGIGEEAPAWAREAARRGPLLAFPSGATDALTFRSPPQQPGDWYPSPELPPSPVAPLLAGVETGDAPPLMALRPVEPPPGAWSPLDARLARRGAARPVVVAGEVAGEGPGAEVRRRAAVAMGDGYWRWAFSGGAGRALYDRLWSAVAGWLLEGSGAVGRDGVAPERRVVERGAPVVWVVAGAGDSLRVVLHPMPEEGASGDGAGASPGSGEGADAADPAVPAEPVVQADAAVLDTTVAITSGSAATPAVPPGRYRYEARAFGGGPAGGGEATGVGELTVESYSPEFTRPAALPGAPEDTVGMGGRSGPGEEGGEGGEGVRLRSGRPLHASPWPYVAVVALLCAEWILRRRWGLR